MSPLKTITPFSGQMVTYSTSVPFAEVTRRMEIAIHKRAANEVWFPALREAKSREEIERKLREIVGEDSLVYVYEDSLDWINLYKPGTGSVIVYVVGSPPVGAPILQDGIRSGLLNTPPRLLICEKENGGTEVHYHLPSAVFIVDDHPGLKAGARIMDEKIEDLVRRITAETVSV